MRLSIPFGYVSATLASLWNLNAVFWLAIVASTPFGALVGSEKPWMTSPYGLNASTVSGRQGIVGGSESDFADAAAASGDMG